MEKMSELWRRAMFYLRREMEERDAGKGPEAALEAAGTAMRALLQQATWNPSECSYNAYAPTRAQIAEATDAWDRATAGPAAGGEARGD